MSTVRVPGALTRLARRHGFTRSPLCRSTDRVEAGVTAALAVLTLLTVLLSTVIAISTYQRVQTEVATKATQQPTAPLSVSTDHHAGDRMSIWIDRQGSRVDHRKHSSP
jgi:hypothetical protein